jgi:hypothetical protein
VKVLKGSDVDEGVVRTAKCTNAGKNSNSGIAGGIILLYRGV